MFCNTYKNLNGEWKSVPILGDFTGYFQYIKHGKHVDFIIWSDSTIPHNTIICKLPDEAIPHLLPYPDTHLAFNNISDSRKISITKFGEVLTDGEPAGWLYVIASYSTS